MSKCIVCGNEVSFPSDVVYSFETGLAHRHHFAIDLRERLDREDYDVPVAVNPPLREIVISPNWDPDGPEIPVEPTNADWNVE